MTEQRCKDCQVLIDHRRRSGYCHECLKRYCSCGATLPEPRLVRRCGDCNRRYHERRINNPNKACYYCGAVILAGRKFPVCHPCSQSAYREKQARARKKPTRTCLHCKAEYPSHLVRSICLECQRAQEARERKKQGRICRQCGGSAFGRAENLCRACFAMNQRLYKTRAQGNPAARLAAQTLLDMRKEANA